MNLKKEIEKTGIEVPKDFWHNIQQYKETLFRWNKTHNLTGAKDESTLDLFIFDALYPLSFVKPSKTLLDIGTGAGFPGLILAMALPHVKVTLAEPLGKRASFLQYVKAMLKLDNVDVQRKKAQDLQAEVFEMITSRAVTDTTLLLEISKNLRDEDTKLLFYKGERVFDEVDESLPHKVIITNNRHYLLIDKNLKD